MSILPVKTTRSSLLGNQRPIILAIVGDSAAGKTTMGKGIAQILGANAAILCTDDYHRYNRKQRQELGLTPLNPESNYIDIMTQHLRLLRAGEPIIKPLYNHALGDLGSSQYVAPHPFLIVEGLLGMYSQEMRNAYSVRVYLDPAEEMRRRWKIQRDTTERGYTEEEVVRQLADREHDSATYIRPQRDFADIVVSFYPGEAAQLDQNSDAHLNVRLTLHGTLRHPDLSEVAAQDSSGCIRSSLGRVGGRAVEYLEIDGSISDEPANVLERFILDRLEEGKATLPSELGYYSDARARDSRRSHPLALTDLLLVYYLLRARERDQVKVG